MFVCVGQENAHTHAQSAKADKELNIYTIILLWKNDDVEVQFFVRFGTLCLCMQCLYAIAATEEGNLVERGDRNREGMTREGWV